MDMINQICVHR